MANGNLEIADGARRGAFPAEWGVPPAGQYSDERARWVKERVREHMALKGVQRRAKVQAAAIRVEHLRRRAQLNNIRLKW